MPSRSPSRSRSRSRSPPRRRSPPRGGRGRSPRRSRSPRRGDRDRGGGDGPVSLLVRNLNNRLGSEDIRDFFGRYGKVRDVYLPKDHYTKMPKGYGFVEFYNYEEAREAQLETDRRTLEGREITVLFAQERRKTPDQMRMRDDRSPPRRRRSPRRSRSRSPPRRRDRRSRSRSRSPPPPRSRSPRGRSRSGSRD